MNNQPIRNPSNSQSIKSFNIILFHHQHKLVILYFEISLVVTKMVLRPFLSRVNVRVIVKVKSFFC
nr:hypothetical protein [uncultured bacterium]